MAKIVVAAVLGLLCALGGVRGESCSSESESTEWELAVLSKIVADDILRPLPKYSYGFQFLAEEEHALTKDTKMATDLLDVSPVNALTYQLETESEVPVPSEKTCDSSNWKALLADTKPNGGPAKPFTPKDKSICSPPACGCYLVHTHNCPGSFYHKRFVPVPSWWCYYEC